MLFYGFFFMFVGFYIFWNTVWSIRSTKNLNKDPKIQILIFNLFLVWALFEIKGPSFYLMATYLLPVTILFMEKNDKEIVG